MSRLGGFSAVNKIKKSWGPSTMKRNTARGKRNNGKPNGVFRSVSGEMKGVKGNGGRHTGSAVVWAEQNGFV